MMYVKEKVNISTSTCPPFYHPSTVTRLSRLSFFLALPLFLFFIPPINTVFYLIERLIQCFILLNDCDQEQKKESLGPRLAKSVPITGPGGPILAAKMVPPDWF